MKKTILITHRLPREHFAELEAQFEVLIPCEERFSKEEFQRLLPRIDGMIASTALRVTDEMMALAPRLKIIASYGVGYDNIDLAAAQRRGIVVTNNPTPVLKPTAEHAYALMLAVAHRIPECDRDLRRGEAKWGIMDNLGTSLYGKTLGIVGMGRIGKALRRYAAASRMRVLYYNRRSLPAEEERALEVEYADFDTLLRESDIVSVHTPLTDESRHLFGPEQFRRMKPTALLVNTARGAVVDNAALAEALRSGEIAGAALDVFENEPRVLPELLTLDNIVLTPHTGTNTVETREQMSAHAARNVMRFFAGDPEIDRVV
ncbi:NAD(P)-dependent oxidoreductase [uncultured Rikenella sp.]|uniref:NAD(P)-dependent oxidoreductase n=1 Tax=uncultured Rikenella sp. TaxID=368003 RepID=UPI00262563B6|nr:NAD(P)-dependent oxidoreductase [uncultured Rikenella sp.]